ncbi:hypothetical protein JTB14_008690 [Gonioctena quinquepunctata]|nr:hypothetical protein JTB14_008690 [Gonioctena quinquepunctata]
MMSGHVYSRAIIWHVLVHLALGKIVLENVKFTSEECADIEEVITDFDDGQCELKLDEKPFRSMSCQFEAQLKQLGSNDPTAKLWLQYHRMVTLVNHFIEAERSGNWDLHLSTVSKMIPFFHATGHFNYAYCSQLFVQDMLQIQEVFYLRESEAT